MPGSEYYDDRTITCKGCGEEIYRAHSYAYTFDMWNDKPVTFVKSFCADCPPPPKPHYTAARIRFERAERKDMEDIYARSHR